MTTAATLPSYPSYKPSGVPWLVDVPEHWRTERGKWLFRKVDRPIRPEDQVVTCFRDGVVTLRKNRRVRGFTEALKEIGYQGIRRGDLVIHAMDGFAGAIGVADSDGKGSPVYSVCTPTADADPYFYAYLLREMARNGWILALAKGIRERSTDFRFADFGEQRVPFPPRSDQSAIVRYLDHVDRRIRKYIRAKQKLIALLNEQKQTIIHRAVTGQIDVRTGKPYPKYKPSGVPWLGDVPEHWDVLRLRNTVTQVTSGSRGWSRYMADDGPIFIRIGNLTRGTLNLDLSDPVRLQLPTDVSEVHRTRVEPNDILVSITAYIGSFAVVPADIEEAYVSQHVALCRPRQTVHNVRWIGYVLLSPVGQGHGQVSLYGGTKDGLSLDDVKNYPVLLPSPEEQDSIVSWVETRTADLDRAVTKTRQQIGLSQEYRTRLVADVVTGKLDVREAAANLPEEAEEAEEVELPGEEEQDTEEEQAEVGAEDKG